MLGMRGGGVGGRNIERREKGVKGMSGEGEGDEGCQRKLGQRMRLKGRRRIGKGSSRDVREGWNDGVRECKGRLEKRGGAEWNV